MKIKIRNKFSIALTMIILFGFSMLFSGCEPVEDPKSFEGVTIKGDFIYSPIEREFQDKIYEGICIISLSDEGKEKERIDFPIEIDGKPIIQLGRKMLRKPKMIGSPSYIPTYFYSKKTKKYVIPWQIMMLDSKYDPNSFWTMAFYSNHANGNPDQIIFVNNEVKLSKDGYPIGDGLYLHDLYKKNCFYLYDTPNTTFSYNFEGSPNSGVFYKDEIGKGKKIFQPPIVPQRDGYEFGGWYEEPSCITKINFNTKIKENEKITLFAKWNQI